MFIDAFHPATRAWFTDAFEAPTDVQQRGWPPIAAGEHTLLIAPTGSGKTLAAFLWAIDRLGQRATDAEPGVGVLYISPLKALVYDVERNLRAPLVGIGRAAAVAGLAFRPPEVSMRTGDTPQRDRRRFIKSPGDILVTTPESLYLLLGGQSRERLRSVSTVIVDEIHALAPVKRGAHLALSLERLSALCDHPPQRVGLSATVRPVEDVARFLGGGHPVQIVDASAPPRLDLEIVCPVRDLDRPQAPAGAQAPPVAQDLAADGMGYGAFQQPTPPRGIWPAIQPRLLELIQAHRSTIVFVNSRSLCERLARALNEMAGGDAGEPLVRAHHGSVSHEQRREIEEGLKSGLLRCIVATSSLELGIDMGAVDLVVQVESPRSTARGLQRAGRAGHGVGQVSVGRIFPKYRGDLLEAAVVARRMQRGELEPIAVPRNPLDVLAQQVVAMVAVQPWGTDALFALVRQAHNFRELSQGVFAAVLDMLAGRYPSTDFATLKARIEWDRERDVLTPRKGASQVALQNAGTIPDRGLYGVHLGPNGPRIGELDEEMVHESRPGETFVLGASTWRVEDVTRDRVVVSPAPGEPGRMPFWHGDGPGRPLELGRAVGAFLRELGTQDDEAGRAWLAERYPLDPWAIDNLVDYVACQRDATGCVPSDRTVVIERFRDELGDWRVCILSPFGARIHAPWGLALEAMLGERSGFEVQAMWADDGIVLRLAETDGELEPPGVDALIPDPDEVEDLVVEQLAASALFAASFRENAGRALLLPRRRAGARTPLWAQRLRAQGLLAVARQYPAFPIVLETYRACLQDHFDVPALQEVLRAIRARDIRVEPVSTLRASPFARALVYRYVAQYMYEGDAPAAERRAQALTLDRDLLRDLLGQDELRDLLDAGEIAALEAELQCLTEARRARHAEGVHDLLRRLGALTPDEVRDRCAEPSHASDWLAELESTRRVARMRVGGEPRVLAVEDCARYRDGVGAVPPPGVADAFLEPTGAPLLDLLRRYARTHGPFVAAAPAARLGIAPGQMQAALALLVRDGALLEGAFRPGESGVEYCDPEVLRRLRRRTLAKLRGEVAPVEAPVLARFLIRWHRVGEKGPTGNLGRLREALHQLEGLPLAFSELEGRVLPARVPGFQPRMLDELGAMGELVWVGRGALGAKDGRVALYRREHLSLLVDPPDDPTYDDPLHAQVLEHLERAGATFLVELQRSVGAGAVALDAALWDLAWAGHVTNDTFGVLRARGAARRGSGGGRRGARGAWRGGPGGGRWSLVRRLLDEAPDTSRAHARATLLLERYGVLSREAAHAEGLRGGFSAVYGVLRAMEEAGRVRRGWFVDGLQGAQFAFPGAIDRLRAVRGGAEAPEVVVVAATDPANPYGSLLPWPPPRGADCGRAGPKRVVGASVVLADGVPVLYLGRGGKRLLTFGPADDERLLGAAVDGLRSLARSARGRSLRVERIDGRDAREGARSELFVRAGFVTDYRGLLLEAD